MGHLVLWLLVINKVVVLFRVPGDNVDCTFFGLETFGLMGCYNEWCGTPYLPSLS
jgi:hypothetical protein